MENSDECVFCEIVRGKINAKITYEDKSFIGILDTNPKSEGHTLIVTKKHFRNLLDLPASLGNELLDSIKKISLKLIEDGKAEGLNIISNNEPSSGQIVFHTHVHVIPRKKNDGLKF